ncbi:hypothetical protein Efla_001862 [Eimeria flavescens]
MAPTDPWLAPPTPGQQPASNTPVGSSPPAWFNLHAQSLPAETLNLSAPPNDWTAMRAATEFPSDGKEWKPKTPPHLVVSIIAQLLKLISDSSPPTVPSPGDYNAQKREQSPGSLSAQVLSSQETPPSVRNSNPAFLASPYNYSRENVQIRYPQEEAVMRPISMYPGVGGPSVVKIGYAEYPSILIAQSRDFLPSVKVRKSSQPAVHIYTGLPLRVDDQYDAVAKQHVFRPLDRLPGEPSRNEQAEEEGLINPYIRQKQPTIFFHYDKQTAYCGAGGPDCQPWQPRICIDTTSLWWPTIQCVFANPPPNSRPNGGINALIDERCELEGV